MFAGSRTDAGRDALVAGGKAGFDRWLASLFAAMPEGVSADPLIGRGGVPGQAPDAVGLCGPVGRGPKHRQRSG